MTQLDKLLIKILSGTSDANIPFSELCQLLRRLGFEERVRGSHHIFSKEGIEEIMNIQPKGSKAKPYQVKQVRTIIIKYQLGGQDETTL
ncbi:type II toxin-antitoxin system HicA family toxin [Lyngbya aestuarii]|uniref:type II toxin-antitoxin system HicA family toxin n=1 Tax=Lyngbya aestuarii TaxID=118322 RepID=UPI00058B7420|nr:type II toxin-antitoxin system HicA family toxin [Lyngbya aestuarii]